MFRHISGSISIVAVTALYAAPLLAQQTAIEEIVVTTQKREQSLQDVPVAVSAFSEEFMNRTGVRDLRDLVDMTPGFNGRTDDSFSDALAIRGISTNDFGLGGDPSVAVFVDGVYEGRNGGGVTSFLDVERAEVVRGPQGTLFGRNAIAGAINVVTNQPEEEFGGSLSATIEEFSHYELSATVNAPITDQLFFRGTAAYYTEDGYLSNLAGGAKLGEHESKAVQAALRWAGDTVDTTFTVFYEERDGVSSVYQSTAPLSAAGVFDDNGSLLPKDKVFTDLGSGSIDQTDVLRLTLDVEVELSGGYSLTSITGYKNYDFNYVEDYDASSALIDNYVQRQDVDYFSQEFRLNSPTEGPVVWFVGASGYSENVAGAFQNRYNEDDLCRALAFTEVDDTGLEGFLPGTTVTGCDDPVFEDFWGDLIDPADILANKPETNVADGDYWGWAIYADATWSVSDRLDITFGARYTFDNKDFRSQVFDSGGALFNNFEFEFYSCSGPDPDRTGFASAADCIDGFTDVRDSADWSAFTPRLAFNYQFSEQVSFYGNIAKGYKSGGFSTFGFDLPAPPDIDGLVPAGTRPKRFDSEDVLSEELGIKTRLADGSLMFNLTLYNYDYQDLQLTFFSAGSTLTGNVAEASGTGAEADLRWLPDEHWDIYFSAAYSSTEIDKVDQAFLDEGGCDNCKGNDLWFAPELSTSLVLTYRHPVNNGASVFVTGEHHYQDGMFSGPDNLALAAVPSWNEVNFQLGYESGSNWSAVVYVNNAFDEEYFERGWENADADNLYGYGIVNALVWPAKPRTIGARVDYNF